MRPVEPHYVTEFGDYSPSECHVDGKKIGFGVDLDGCVDMGMEKHLLAFGVASIIHYGFQPIQSLAMKAWMYANYYSLDRGVSRFIALFRWADIVRGTRAAQGLGLPVADFRYLRRWCDVTSAYSPEALATFIDAGDFTAILEGGDSQEAASEELADVLDWSGKVNALVPDSTANMAAFPNAVKMIHDGYQRGADYAIVSGTPQAHIEAQVGKYGIAGCLEGLWGQQAGRKSQGLVTMMVGPVERDKLQSAIDDGKPLLESREAVYDALVMIGDAPKDNEEREKATLALSGRKDGPIRMHLVPVESENDSWAILHGNLDKIIAGTWSADEEAAMIADGLANLSVEWDESPVYNFRRA